MQDSAANCGVFALLNALRALGIQRSAEELERLCGTTATDGTSLRGIVNAARKIEGVVPVVLRERRRDVALLRLHGALTRGRPAVLSWCSSVPGDHWTAAIGLLGERYLVADSGDNELVPTFSVEELAMRWVDGGRYEGVVL